ncbi:hypothetical protein PSTT_02102 [Puccinia striiformis]|uniref:T4 RNA ligase 1-like N-terminal domain-containing protein n=1 Tax=Puccinia striiformis TaxID=27350 RepID=A0A2S4W1A9_9BASI|nr:hypothetical protein PSTT_02102 [Puccinia striiformis]
MARGLFTRENIHPNQLLGQGRHSIVARGYDKFFNIDELPSTKWEALESRSQAPYHLTLQDKRMYHILSCTDAKRFTAGERWVGRHLAKVGMSSAQLAHELWEANATAVAELTDDDFEEHVIATRPTKTLSEDSGHGWVGRQGHVEGVVVRGTPRHQGIIADSNLPTASIFWKVKFEEPYLTYREWRELTRKMLNEMALNRATFEILPCASPGKSLNLSDSEKLAKVLKVNVKKIHKPETRLYVHWVIEELLNRPQTFELWQKNRGIALRMQLDLDHNWRRNRILIKLYWYPLGFLDAVKQLLLGTKELDDFIHENVKGLLLEKAGPGLVIADKNNHLKTHRAALAELIHKLNEGIHVKKGKGKGSREAELVRMRTRIDIRWIGSSRRYPVEVPKTYEEFDPEINSEDQDFRQMIELKFTASIEDSLKEFKQWSSPNLKPEVKKEMKIEPALQNPRYFGIKLTVNLCELGDKFLGKLWMIPCRQQSGKAERFHQNQTEESEEMKRLWDEYQKRVLQRKVNIRLKLGPKLIWNDRIPCHYWTANESIRPVEGFDLLHCYFGTGKSPPSSSSTQPILPTSTSDGVVAVDGGEICSIDVEIACINGTLKGLS